MSAVISPCGRYRYVLTRDVTPLASLPTSLLWVMLNPSTADAETDDATVRKCLGFAKRWTVHGVPFQSMTIVNLFAWRATDPVGLSRAGIEPIGEDNDRQIQISASLASRVVVGWGAGGDSFPERVNRLRFILDDFDAPPALFCLGTTKSGQPKHPLYVPYDQPLVPWSAP